jgi:hypothetical protein
MVYIFSGLINWLRSLFFAKHLEVTIVGLQVRTSLSCTAVLDIPPECKEADLFRQVVRPRKSEVYLDSSTTSPTHTSTLRLGLEANKSAMSSKRKETWG